MKRKSAAGPDGIPTAFLKELGPIALTELLGIFNVCFSGSFCPQIWRLAHIIPLLNAGKPASDLVSYRPISLTSCIVKLLERMSTTGSITSLNYKDGSTPPKLASAKEGDATTK